MTDTQIENSLREWLEKNIKEPTESDYLLRCIDMLGQLEDMMRMRLGELE